MGLSPRPAPRARRRDRRSRSQHQERGAQHPGCAGRVTVWLELAVASVLLLAVEPLLVLCQRLLPQLFGIACFGSGQRACRRSAHSEAFDEGAQPFHAESVLLPGDRPGRRIRSYGNGGLSPVYEWGALNDQVRELRVGLCDRGHKSLL